MASTTKMNISSTVSDSSLDHTLDKQKKNREFVIKKYEKGKYVRVERTFEKEGDEEEFERYREDMLREYDFTFGDDWDGSMDEESYIVRCWVGLVIDKWYDEEDESKKRKKKPEWKDTTELIEETLKNAGIRYDEEEAESRNRKKKPDWKDTTELIEENSSESNETYSDWPLPLVFSTKPSPLQLKEPQLKEPW